VVLGCVLLAFFAQTIPAPRAPYYTAESFVSAASNAAGPVSPHSIASLYGENLAWVTRAIRPEDLRGNQMPTVLPGSGVRVIIGGLLAGIYYASPSQVNLLVPNELLPGRHTLEVVRDGVAGPRVTVTLAAEAPELFQTQPGNWAVATRADGSPVTPQSPASPGDTLILYATGLGRTVPDSHSGQIAAGAASLARRREFNLWLNDLFVDAVHYVGLTPGFAGLYQINVTLPRETPPNPEIRLGFAGRPMSRLGVRLAVKEPAPAEAGGDHGA